VGTSPPGNCPKLAPVRLMSRPKRPEGNPLQRTMSLKRRCAHGGVAGMATWALASGAPPPPIWTSNQPAASARAAPLSATGASCLLPWRLA
jgi:hypothetical protein